MQANLAAGAVKNEKAPDLPEPSAKFRNVSFI
jgi:hypothetical protein